jgi:acyl dehydratase
MDISAVGYQGPSFPFAIEAGKVHELARAVGSTQAAYLDEVPIAMPIVLKVAQFHWEPSAGSAVDRVGFDLRTPPLHARQEFEFLGPPPSAGVRLRAQTTVDSIRERPSRRLGRVGEVVLSTDFRDVTGTVVARARTTSVQPLMRPSEAAVAPSEVARTTAGYSTRGLGPITQTEVVRYQGASGDFNPVHHDEAVWRAAGWPAVLVPGLYPAAVLSDLATEQFGAEQIRRLDITFGHSVWLGESLQCALAAPVHDDDGRIRVGLSCIRTSDGLSVTAGSAVFTG